MKQFALIIIIISLFQAALQQPEPAITIQHTKVIAPAHPKSESEASDGAKVGKRGSAGISNHAAHTNTNGLFISDACHHRILKLLHTFSDLEGHDGLAHHTTGDPIDPDMEELAAQCTQWMLLSKLVGIAVVMISPLLKVSLLVSLFKQDERLFIAEHLQFSSLFLELLSQLIGLAFNLRMHISMSAYAETYMLLIQNVVIISSALFTLGHSTRAVFFVLGAFLFMNFLLNPAYVHANTLISLVGLGMPITLLSLVPVIYHNFRVKHTLGIPISMLLLAQVMGCGRILTTAVDVSTDFPILGGAIVGPCLNLILICQVMAYRDNTRREMPHAQHKE